MISLLHLVPELNAEVRRGVWRQRLGRELGARTVGVVGCGHVGKEVVRLLAAFGCRTLVHDIRPMDEYCADHGARQVALDALLSESEIITARTRLLFDAPLLDRTREGVILVNMARGGIVDEHALKLRLKSGRISAAAFDVFAQERRPIPSS